MILQVKTPSTKITAKCCRCGYSIYVYDVPSVVATDMFTANGWVEDEHGRPVCPECNDSECGS